MKILDAGHVYKLDSIDGGEPQSITFVKREGDNFPFNEGAHPGTNCQEVLRALIDRTEYLLRQKPCAETESAAYCLRAALTFYELRAARRHKRFLDLESTQSLLCAVVCQKCKHVGCEGSCHAAKGTTDGA